MARAAQFHAVLDASELLEGRPFTHPVRTFADAAVMTAMLQRQREIVRSWIDAAAPGASVRDDGTGGERRRYLAVPSLDGLCSAREITAIGFFGQARDRDHSVLFELERDVASAFPEYAAAGLLSYFDLELEDGSYGFGNLILFSTPDVPREWYGNAAHERAVAIAPRNYHSIRLHKGTIHGPFAGTGSVRVDRTKYFDFDDDPHWRGVLMFPPV